VTTACDPGYHKSDSAITLDPTQEISQVAASGEISSPPGAFQALRQLERAKITEREIGTMRSLIETIFPPRTNRELKQLTADYNYLANSLQKTHDELQKAKNQLRRADSELHQAHCEVHQLKDSIHRCRAELQASKCEISTLQDKERSMRDFLIENNHNQIISDRDVCEKFTQLRQRIQRLASNKAYDIEEYHNLPLDERWFQGRYIGALWNLSPKSGRVAILRSLMFQFLHNNILNLFHFDIDDKKVSPYLAQVCNPIPSLGLLLSYFEKVIGDCVGKKAQKVPGCIFELTDDR
jgi:hypothetical protein